MTKDHIDPHTQPEETHDLIALRRDKLSDWRKQGPALCCVLVIIVSATS